METKRPCIRVGSGPPRGGVSIPSLGEGSGYYSGGPGPLWGSGTPRGSGLPREVRNLRLFGLSACFSRNTWCSRTFPSRGTGPGPLSGEQGSGPQGSGCSDVVKNNHKALA